MRNPGPAEAPLRGRPDCSVILVNWNTRDLLLRALRSIPGAAPGRRVEIVVVDNASSDGSAAAVREALPEAVLVENAANVGFARGVNAGLDAARGEMLALLNSDAWCGEGSLAAALDYLARNPRVGLVGGAVRYPDGRHQPTAFRFPGPLASWLEFGFLGLRTPLGLREEPGRTGSVDWVSGAWMVFRREVVRDAGALDPEFFLYAEDTDWCRRIRGAGWEVHYLDAAPVVHEAGGSAGVKRGWNPAAVGSRLRYLRKHHGAPAAQGVRLLLLATWTALLLVCLPASLFPGARGARFRDRTRLLGRLLAGHAGPEGAASRA